MSPVKILPDDFIRLTNELLCRSGVDTAEASIIARNLVWCDQVGRYTHGVWRLAAYLKRFNLGLIQSPCNPNFEKKTEVVYIIHGNSGFGQYLGVVAMDKAINVAKQYGIGVVGVCNSNHFGAGAYYVERAAQNAQIGLATSNSVPHVAAYGGIPAVLGTNPFAFGVPTKDGQSVLVDFSTSASAGSMIMKALEQKKNIPEGIVIDDEGNSIVDPMLASKGTLLPFGGAKGFCMGLMVEILSGVITGAGISHGVASMFKDFSRAQNVGHLLMAMDISKIMPLEDYYSRMSQLITFIKESKKMKGFDEILIPGERRWRYFEKQKQEGIQLDKKTIDALNELTKELGVATPW